MHSRQRCRETTSVVRAPELSLHGQGPTNRMLSVPSRCGDTHRKQNTILAGSRAALPSSTPTCCLSPSPNSAEQIIFRARILDSSHLPLRTATATALALSLTLVHHPTRSPGSAASTLPDHSDSRLGYSVCTSDLSIPLPSIRGSATPRSRSKQPPQQRRQPAHAPTPARTHARRRNSRTRSAQIDQGPQLLSSVRHPQSGAL